MRPVNPFHLYGVYDRDNDLSKLGYYQVPTYRTMSFQFLRSGSDTVSAFDLVTSSGTVLSQDVSEIATYAISGGSTFYWSQGNTLTNPPSNGTLYRPRVTLSGGAIYWGHQCLANAVFDISFPALSVGSCSSTEVTLLADFPVGANVQVKVSDNNSSYESTFNPSALTIDLSELTQSGGFYGATVTVNSYIYAGNTGSRSVSTQYTLTADILDVCGTAALSTGTQTGLEEINNFELTINNSTDIQSKGILYSQGFRQKMWFSGEFLQPEARVTENYKENGEGDITFQSARLGEAQRFEFWPCPDRASLGLSFAKYSSSVILTGAGLSSTLYLMEFEPVPVENEDRPKGLLVAEFDGAFVQNTMENYGAG